MPEGWRQRRKRVLFVNRFYWPDESATAQILTDLAETLASSGFEVHIATSRLRYESSKGKATLPPEAVHERVHIHRLWSTAFGRAGILGRLTDYLTIYLSFLWYLLKEPLPSDIVVLKTDPPLLSILGWVASSLRSFRTVAWCQDLFPEVAQHAFPPFPGKRLLFGSLEGLRDLSLGDTDAVAVISDDMAENLRARGIRSRIITLPNWAVQPETNEGPDYLALRDEWGLSGQIVLGYSGNLGRAHDIETVIQALPELAALEGLTLLFIGGGVGYRMLRELAGNYRKGFLRFMPYQPREHLSQTLKVPHFHWFSLQPEMTALVSPSKFYGILEAGRPMIFLGKAGSSLAKRITDDGCGLAVPSGDTEQLVESVRLLYSEPELRERMGQCSTRLAEGACSRTARLHQWNQFLDHPAPNRGRAGQA